MNATPHARSPGPVPDMTASLAPKARANDEIPAFPIPDLEQHTAVTEFVAKLGYGEFVTQTLTSPFGRNAIWAGETTSGGGLFVKQIIGNASDVDSRLRRIESFEKAYATVGADAMEQRGLRVPAVVGIDRDSATVVYRLLSDSKSGAQLMVDETFDNDTAYSVGRAAAALHDMPTTADLQLDTSLPALPSLDLVNGLPLETFENISFGEMQAWRLQQNDRPLIDALVELNRREMDAPKVPGHCDFRVDQLMLSGGDLYITDWEEFRLADPARDVGGFAGEWLYRSILDIVTTRGDDAVDESTLDHHSILLRGAQKVERLRPRIQSFWRGYQDTRGTLDEDFSIRATAFAGWHMLDRLIAGSSYRARLSGIERAAAGIGRGVLLNAERFSTVIGLGDAA